MSFSSTSRLLIRLRYREGKKKTTGGQMGERNRWGDTELERKQETFSRANERRHRWGESWGME